MSWGAVLTLFSLRWPRLIGVYTFIGVRLPKGGLLSLKVMTSEISAGVQCFL